ncbi:cell wall-binding repeat-containing protein [Fictibacillus nanhaiensis]|uniref:N,N-dimethylformamidase beta subunit family domain-containing protein n=1 Tax=Fictibacillus nanhaiensis TaxID=742169 RepID=UPI001C95CF7B|nr:N,N-dimethylformamidase beta subunit family domain-containing protein [Fictibacillus nanhaiensis]MBY6037091.1 cell wall-binding repeat-containing protein [Fictibacillus nanhaiensis]
MKKLFFCTCFFISLFILAVIKNYAIASGPVERLDGKDRFEVAVNVSLKGWKEGADTVIVSNYNTFADALSASPLAFKENAPILLTQSHVLTAITKNEIERLNPEKVIIVGGTASVSDKVLGEIKKLAPNVERVGGKDRFEVSFHIAKRLGNSTKAIIVNGYKFPDALTIAPYAAKEGIPILLTLEDKIPESTQLGLKEAENTLVVGGEGSVGPLVYNQLQGRQRIGGKDRFEVAANIIRTLNMNSDRSYISTGLTFADALTGSVLAAKNDVPMLLTRPDTLPESTREIIIEKNIQSFTVLGGVASVQEGVASLLRPVKNNHDIEGYSNKISYFPGETIQLKVHAPNNRFSLSFIRHGKEAKTYLKTEVTDASSQNYFLDSYREGAFWKTSYAYKVPTDWPTGMYSAKLTDGTSEFHITFVIKKRNPVGDDIAVLASTNTWEAYNSWGGKSLYSYSYVNGARNYNEVVSSNRPNPEAIPTGNEGHLANGERHILSWLERNNHPYSMISEFDLHQHSSLLNSYKTLIISTHSEYWSTPMYRALEGFLKRGGNVLYLSGNGIYWKVALKGNQIEVKKDGGYHSFTSEKGGNLYKIGMPETALVGVGYRSTGFSDPAPYKVMNSTHWIFANTGIRNGNLIGKIGLNKVNGSTGGASGWETDQVDKYTPKNYVLLARGTNTIGKGADMIYYDHPGGGGVFSTGSITFGGSLVVDTQLTKIVNNVLKKFGH